MHSISTDQKKIKQLSTLSSRLVRALLFNQMPNYLIAFVTGRCNMNCRYCCDIAQQIKNDKELPPHYWAYAVKDARALIHLTITGGEPFMREDLDALVIGMAKSSGVPNVSINTNGYYTDKIYTITENILASLPGVYLTIALSLDGPPEVHDKLRSNKGTANAVFNTINKLSVLRKTFPNFKIRIQSLLLPENADNLEELFADTSSWPVDFHEIIFPRDVRGREFSMHALATTYKKIVGRRKSDSTLECRMFHTLYNNVLNNLHEDNRSTPCYAGGRLVEILPGGKVVGCEMSKVREKSVIGFIGKSGERLNDICKSRKAGWFRKEIAQKCKCTFECAHICNAIFRLENWPRLILR
ncbi:MAG: radical SAM protein [Nitrospirae bacterium]|nr:radical SAM protein [Nitrospirota bacterium]